MGNTCTNESVQQIYENQTIKQDNHSNFDSTTNNSNFNNSKNKVQNDRNKINESKNSEDERDYERARSREEEIINSDERMTQKSKNVRNNQSSSKTKTKNSEEDTEDTEYTEDTEGIDKNENTKHTNANNKGKSARSPPEGRNRKKTNNNDDSNESSDESLHTNNNEKSEGKNVILKLSKKKRNFEKNYDSVSNDVRNKTPNPQKSNEIKTKHEPNKKRYSAIKYPGLREEMYDTILYRAEYIGDEDDPKLNKNLMFYKNEIESEPDGDTIKTILLKWKGDYKKLEKHHGYIQWLFPIREQGLNEHAHPLQLHELKELKESRTVVKRLIESYKLMLDFYGMEIENKETGELKRSENYKERYRNLIRHTHNNLRITRILKCLGEFDLNSYQMKLLEFIILEVFQSGELESLDDSLTRYWIHTVKDDNERERLIRQVEDMVDKNY